MKIVDTHQHLWDKDLFHYAWLEPLPALDRSFRLDDYGQASRLLEIEKTVFVECDVDESQMMDEALHILRLADDPTNRIAGIVAFVLQSSHGGVMLIGAQWVPQLISTPSLPSKTPPFPAQPDSSPVQVTAAEAAPLQAAPLSPTGPQDAATVAPAAPDLTQLLQKLTGDIANLEQAVERLKAQQDQMASDNAKAIGQLKTKQEDMARLLAKVSEQSASPKTSPPSAGPALSTQTRIQPAPPPRRLHSPRWQYYYDDDW